MIFDYYNITLTKKVWNPSVAIEDVNIFSGISPDTTTTIDLQDYIIDCDEIQWSFDNTDDRSNVPSMFYETSDMKYVLSGRYNNKFLVDFLGIFRDTTFEKYIIEIQDKITGIKIHQGICSQENIKQSYKNSPDSERIEALCLGFEKELKARYQSKPLPGGVILEGVTFYGMIPDLVIRDPYGIRHCLQFQLFMELQMPNVNFIFDANIQNWVIARDPFLGVDTSGRLRLIKSSYERAYAANENVWNWFESICLGMGWIYYYYNGSMYVRNRSSQSGAPVTLDVNDLKSPLDFSKTQHVVQFDNIVVLDGVMKWRSGGHLVEDLARFQIFTTRQSNPNGLPFDGIESGGTHRLTATFGLEWQEFSGEDANTWNYLIKKWSVGIFGGITTDANITIDKKDTLQLAIGLTGAQGWAYNNSGSNETHNGLSIPPGGNYAVEMTDDLSDDTISFTGNYASALCYISDDYHLTYTYEEYVKTDTWKQNFSKFFNKSLERKVEAVYKGVMADPLDFYNFENDDKNYFNNANWGALGLKVNLKTRNTTLQLQEINE